jgi:hypothetical protein
LRQENSDGRGDHHGRNKDKESETKRHDRQPYVRHRPAIRARIGSATGLNAGSQPIGTYTGKGDVSLDFVPTGLTGRVGSTGRRSPLSARLTLIEELDPTAFGAVAAQTTEATVQLRNTAAANCFRLQPKNMTHSPDSYGSGTRPLGLEQLSRAAWAKSSWTLVHWTEVQLD